MTTTYTESLISDESTDSNSPINETVVQGIARSLNYVQDAVLDGGRNSERIGITLFTGGNTESNANHIGYFVYDSEANFDADFYIYIPSQYSGVDVNYKFGVVLTGAGTVTLTVGSGSTSALSTAGDKTGTLTPGSTGVVACNLTSAGIAAGESLGVSYILLYIAST